MFPGAEARSKEIIMGISNMVKNAAGRYLGRSGTTPTTGRTRAGGLNTTGRTGTPASGSGGVGKILRGLLNRR
jgi:hypothetical protein